MGRRRKHDKHLPQRVYLRSGGYYFVDMDGKWNPLGRDYGQALAKLGEMVTPQPLRTLGDILDRYEREEVPQKASRTQEDNRLSIGRLRPVFGKMRPEDLKPQDCYQYLDKRRQFPVSANHDIQVLSHVYTKAIEWGVVDQHPIIGKVKKHKRRPRDRYVTDTELDAACAVAGDMLRAYIALKLLTGLRKGDMLRLTMRDLQEDGLHVQPHKTARTTGRRQVFEWTPALKEAVAAAKAARPKDIAPWLFLTRTGRPYIRDDGKTPAFNCLWQRFMKRVEKAEVEHFTEHDLRAKAGSDAPSLERARELLGHASGATTQRIYRRKPEYIRPAK